ncbi:GAK system ATP-grasp enzyme [Nannocystaceae bacterium ST9]
MNTLANSSPKIAVVGIAGGWSTERLLDALEARTGHRLLIEMQHVVAELGGVGGPRLVHRGLDLCSLDGVIVKKIAETYSPDALDRVELLRVLAGCGVRVFSRPQCIGPLIDRLSCTIKLQLGGIAMPATVVTESVDEARATVARFGGVIAKPLYTSKARGMLLLREPGSEGATLDEDQLRAALHEFKRTSEVMYLQQLIDIPGRDLGVAFLAGEYMATYARVRGGGSWSTSTSAGGKYQAHEPSREVLELAHRAQSLFELDFTCVDVVETREGPKVFEVSAFGGFRGLEEACGIDAAGAYAEHALRCLARERGIA